MEALWVMISSATTLAIEVSVCYYLIFKSEWVIKKFRLTDGFEQEIIPLNMHRSTIIYIAVIIIGGLILTDEIPNLCRRVFSYIRQRQTSYNADRTEAPFIVISLVKIILAILILLEWRRIVSLILRKTNPGTNETKG
jgi:hypothetical protein